MRAHVPTHLFFTTLSLCHLFRPLSTRCALVPVFPLVDADDPSPFACRNRSSSFPAASFPFLVLYFACTALLIIVNIEVERGSELSPTEPTMRLRNVHVPS